MTIGGDGVTSHILDPRSARPVLSPWRVLSVSAPSAALADALSTAACLTEDRDSMETLCRAFPSAAIENAVAT